MFLNFADYFCIWERAVGTVGSGVGGVAMPADFGRSVNTFPTRGQIILPTLPLAPPFGLSDLPTALGLDVFVVKTDAFIEGKNRTSSSQIFFHSFFH